MILPVSLPAISFANKFCIDDYILIRRISNEIQKNVQIKPVLIGQQEAGQPTQDMFFDPRKFNLDGVDIVYEDD